MMSTSQTGFLALGVLTEEREGNKCFKLLMHNNSCIYMYTVKACRKQHTVHFVMGYSSL